MLNEHQRRRVAAGLRQIEGQILAAEAALTRTCAPAHLVRWQNDIPPGLAEQLLPRMQQAQTLVAEIAGLLKLPPTLQSRWSAVRGALSAAWSDAEDLQSTRLRAYGDLSEDSAQQWDTLMRRLADDLTALLALTSTPDRSAR